MKISKNFLLVFLVSLVMGLVLPGELPAQRKGFTDSFMLDQCGGFSPTGTNPFFVLQPGFQLILQGNERKEAVNLTITVLSDTRLFSGLDIGGGVIADVLAQVVEERETKDGVLVEVSRNYFAICDRTNSVIYFGEDVDIYDDMGTTVVSHEGAWLAGVNGARAGIIMPGVILLGGRYFQEVAPGIALDRAEIISMTETVVTPAGSFTNCLKTFETTPLDRRARGFKVYAPGIGLIKDGVLELVSSGFVALP